MRKQSLFLSLLLACAGVTTQAQNGGLEFPRTSYDEEAPVYYAIKNVATGQYASYTNPISRMELVETPTSKSLFYFTSAEESGTGYTNIRNFSTTNVCANFESWTREGEGWLIYSDDERGFNIAKDNTGESCWTAQDREIIDAYNSYSEENLWLFERQSDREIYAILVEEARSAVAEYADHIGTGYFVPKREQYEMLKNSVPTEDPVMEEELHNAVKSLQEAISAFYKSMLPEVGREYLIKELEKGYLTVKPSKKISPFFPDFAFAVGGYGASAAPTAETVWVLESGNAEGLYRFRNKETEYSISSSYKNMTYLGMTVDGTDFILSPAYGSGTTGIGGGGTHEGWYMDGGNDLVNFGSEKKWVFEDLESSDLPEPMIWDKLTSSLEHMASIFGIEESEKYKEALAEHIKYKNSYVAYLALSAINAEVKNRFYRLQSMYTDRPNMIGTQGENAFNYVENNTDAGLIWQFEASENGYKLFNVNKEKYLGPLSANQNSLTPLVDMPESVTFGLRFANESNELYFREGFEEPYNKYMDCSSNGHLIKGGDILSNCRWKILPAIDLEVPLQAVQEASYATAYLPFAVKTDGNAQLYTGTLVDNELVMTEQEAVPAMTGFVIKSESQAAGAVLSIIGQPEMEEIADNSLTGSLEPISTNVANYFVLGKSSATDEVCFYRPTDETAGIAGNKAFLAAEDIQEETETVMLNFGGSQTGIQKVSNSENTKEKPIYDLSGRRVFKMTKGNLYIQGGKKIVGR